MTETDAPPVAPAVATPEQQAQFVLLCKSLISRLPALSNPFAGLTSSTAVSQVKLEVTKLLDIKAYKRPASYQDALSRLRQNVMFFRLTYTFVTGLILLIYVISNAGLFVAVGVLVAMWSWFLSQPAEHVLKLGAVELKRTEKLVVLSSLSVVTVVFGGLLSAILYVLFQTSVIVGSHAMMREPVQLDALEELSLESEKLVSPADKVASLV